MSLTNVNIDWFGKSDIQKGLIDTVIVKDQSRFGRSYIQVGMYAEQFKDMGVRFIAVDDCYDSSQTDYDMMFPMCNVINEYYAREASKKTKSAKKAKAKAGQFIGSKPPFGYKLDPNDRHHLIVDEPAAEVVSRIFHTRITRQRLHSHCQNTTRRKGADTYRILQPAQSGLLQIGLLAAGVRLAL